MKKFNHISEFIKLKRELIGLSQIQLSTKLGYPTKNGQFISNIERGKCSLPSHKIGALSCALSVDKAWIVQAMVNDYRDGLESAK